MTLFQYAWRSPVFDESLVVDDDGALHLYVLVPGDDAHRDQAGTYFLPADASRVERLQQRLVDVGAREGAEAELAGELRTEALAHPLAVIRASATFLSPIPTMSVTNVIVDNIGTIDVMFELDPSSLQLCWPGGTQPLTPPTIGFLNGSGELVDGLHTPATLPAGTRAACSLVGDVALPDAVSLDTCWVSFAGKLLTVPDATGATIDIAVPTEQFVVTTRPESPVTPTESGVRSTDDASQ